MAGDAHQESDRLRLSTQSWGRLQQASALIAQYFNIDSLIIRGLFPVAFFAFGTGALVYAVLSVVMPRPDTA